MNLIESLDEAVIWTFERFCTWTEDWVGLGAVFWFRLTLMGTAACLAGVEIPREWGNFVQEVLDGFLALLSLVKLLSSYVLTSDDGRPSAVADPARFLLHRRFFRLFSFWVVVGFSSLHAVAEDRVQAWAVFLVLSEYLGLCCGGGRGEKSKLKRLVERLRETAEAQTQPKQVPVGTRA